VEVIGEIEYNVDGAGFAAWTNLLEIEQFGKVGEMRLVLVN
jgi:hypothetical protein